MGGATCKATAAQATVPSWCRFDSLSRDKLVEFSESGEQAYGFPRGASSADEARPVAAVAARQASRQEVRTFLELLVGLEDTANAFSQAYRCVVQRPSVDDDILKRSDLTLRRVVQQLKRLQRLRSGQTWHSNEADHWVTMYTGSTRRFQSLPEIVRKVQVESRIVRHWWHQTSLSKGSTESGVLMGAHLDSSCKLQLDIDAWDGVDVFEVEKDNQQPLTHVFVTIWRRWKLGQLCKASKAKVLDYIVAIESLYKQNAYHNRIHAADVTLSAYFFWSQLAMQDRMQDYFTEVDLLALIVASAVHDVAHPGVNNDFLVKTRHALSLRYNDRSVLENYHAATAFELMKDKQVPLLEHNLPSPPPASLRSRIVDMVLATDMAHHKSGVEDLSNELERHQNVQDIDKLVLEKQLLHMADIAHPMRPFRQHHEWTRRITEEFLTQGDQEKELGFSPMALFDREKVPSLAGGQLGFLNFVVKPGWKVLAAVLGPAAVAPQACLEANVTEWERQIADEEAAKAKAS